MSAALSTGGDGAFICKVIVTDYVSDTSADSGLPSMFGSLMCKKKSNKPRQLAKSCRATKRK